MKKSIADVLKRLRANDSHTNWNNFFGKDVAEGITANLNYIVDVMWLPSCDDTMFIIPKKGILAERSLKLMGYEVSADEIDFVSPAEVLHQVVQNYGYPAFDDVTDEDKEIAKAFVKGRTGHVLRLWWD